MEKRADDSSDSSGIAEQSDEFPTDTQDNPNETLDDYVSDIDISERL